MNFSSPPPKTPILQLRDGLRVSRVLYPPSSLLEWPDTNTYTGIDQLRHAKTHKYPMALQNIVGKANPRPWISPHPRPPKTATDKTRCQYSSRICSILIINPGSRIRRRMGPSCGSSDDFALVKPAERRDFGL